MGITKDEVLNQVSEEFSSLTNVVMKFNPDLQKDIIHIKNNDRQMIFHAQCKSGHIHNTKVLINTLIKAQFFKTLCIGVFFRIGIVKVFWFIKIFAHIVFSSTCKTTGKAQEKRPRGAFSDLSQELIET